jgi:phage I-like protein
MTLTHYAQADSGVLEESIVNDDGTLWSHAATLGTRFKGSAFTIDKATVENFIKVFTAGYPRKVPVDYEHGTVNGATERGQPVPAAGTIVELRGVYAVKDFDGALKTAAEKLTARMGRELDDIRNFGLWMRWRPTARALEMVKSAEYTEVSIAFSENYPHNVTSVGQGPTLLSVALTNMPFLDDMVSIAATRDGGGSAAAPPSGDRAMPTAILLSAAAAVSGKAVATDEEATTILTSASSEITRLRAFHDKLSVELTEVDPDKAHAKLREIKNENNDFRLKAEKAEEKRVEQTVATTMKEFEDRTTPFSRDKVWAPALKTELRANPQLDVKQTETYKALKQEKPHHITDQSSSGDSGQKGPNQQDRLLARAQELMKDDPEVKEAITKRGRGEAFMLAFDKAEAEEAARAAQ